MMRFWYDAPLKFGFHAVFGFPLRDLEDPAECFEAGLLRDLTQLDQHVRQVGRDILWGNRAGNGRGIEAEAEADVGDENRSFGGRVLRRNIVHAMSRLSASF